MSYLLPQTDFSPLKHLFSLIFPKKFFSEQSFLTFGLREYFLEYRMLQIKIILFRYLGGGGGSAASSADPSILRGRSTS